MRILVEKISMSVVSVAMIAPLLAMASGNSGNGSNYNAANYDLGKKVFYEDVVCSSCPYSDLELVKEEVTEVIPALAKNGDIGKNLNSRERKSVKLYLKSRFKL